MPEKSAMDKAQAAMRTPLPRRFYDAASWRETDDGFAVELDGRPVRTPGRRALSVPRAPLAEALAAEWDAQGAEIDPTTMPLTRIANSAIDGVADNAVAVRDDVVRFVSADLLCYRAEGPAGLVERQNAAWDPILAWARRALDLEFALAAGVMHVDQPPATLERATAYLDRLDPLHLASTHVMTTLTGSAVLTFALLEGRLDASGAWEAAHVDEDWQISQWGADAEAMRRRAERQAEFDAAARIVDLLRG